MRVSLLAIMVAVAGCLTTATSFSMVPPTVTLTSPANNSGFSTPAMLSLTVDAADADGLVTNVAYYNGATKLADVTTSPFSYSLANAPAGIYALNAIASDNDGLTSTSSVVQVSITNSPAVQILQQAKTIFVIAMENHSFTQPNPTSSPKQIFTNPAAPYINSLITPGHSNAVQVSYATKYYNAGMGVHPSEPNYIWAEGGTDFGHHLDNDPTGANGNVFTNDHLTRQLNAAGIAWKNYQEDLEYAASPTNSASGSSGAINPYHGRTQYDYAVKHNPMAFYTETQIQNVSPLTNLLQDLTHNAIGRYNWITPDQFNDQHSTLTRGFTNNGVAYTGDQASIAQGDHFLATLIPQIIASPAYRDHGVIILWWDESEGGDSTSFTIPEIIISPMAKGNAYASALEYSHSSDVKTMEEIFGLPFLTNTIPASETNASGSGYNDVATANDLSDMFQGLAGINVQQPGAAITNGGSATAFGAVNLGASATNVFTITNSGLATLVLSNVVATGANASDFTVTGITLPAAIAVGGSATFSVVFSPAAAGARASTLEITNNDVFQTPFAIALTGAGNAKPVITAASTITVEATNASGNAVFFTVTANDAEDGSLTPFVNPASGSTFPLGTNTVIATATDSNGFGVTNAFLVIVQDTIAPVISWSFMNLTLNATGNCTALMIDVTGTNYILASDACSGSALTITQTPTNNASLKADTTNQIVIAVADSAGNTAYSTNWIVVADAIPPVIIRHPLSLTNNAGMSANFSVEATGCTQLRYQWHCGTNVLAGETNSVFSIGSVCPTNAGDYHVMVTSAGGHAHSDPATLTVIYQAPTIVGGQMMPGTDGFQLTFSGPAGQTYRVLVSDDLAVPLTAWTVVGGGTFGSTNAIFTDTETIHYPSRFYILKSP